MISFASLSFFYKDDPDLYFTSRVIEKAKRVVALYEQRTRNAPWAKESGEVKKVIRELTIGLKASQERELQL